MGCEESRTTGDNKPQSQAQQKQKIGSDERALTIDKKLTGLLEKELQFQDCLIQSDSDLENKIRLYIPRKKPDENNPGNYVPNLQDDIVTNSLKIDFTKFDVIAMSAINITNVSEKHGDYVVYHDGQAKSSGIYCAVVVEKIAGNPQISFATPKPTPTD